MPTQTLTVHLPQTFADAIQRKVASGEFASESDVIISALLALDAEDSPHDEARIENWLKNEVVPIALRMEANPAEGHSIEDVLATLERDSEEDLDEAHAA
jgi:antitoxin ParD1/3/4